VPRIGFDSFYYLSRTLALHFTGLLFTTRLIILPLKGKEKKEKIEMASVMSLT
jgi:hypothetical protein